MELVNLSDLIVPIITGLIGSVSLFLIKKNIKHGEDISGIHKDIDSLNNDVEEIRDDLGVVNQVNTRIAVVESNIAHITESQKRIEAFLMKR